MKLGGLLAVLVAVASAGCAAEEPPVSQRVADYYSNGPGRTAAPDPVLVTVIGDSYVAGSDMGGTSGNNWAALVVNDLQPLGAVDVARTGVGGSGYVARGPKNTVFGEVVESSVGPKTDLVVFFGSINDRGATPESVGTAALEAYADTKRIAPEAKLLVIGPAWTNPDVPAVILANRDALRKAAERAGTTWVDPIAERWFFDRPTLIGMDKTHPTDEGHAYMEQRILPHLLQVLRKG